jgi:hypothetical protein
MTMTNDTQAAGAAVTDEAKRNEFAKWWQASPHFLSAVDAAEAAWLACARREREEAAAKTFEQWHEDDGPVLWWRFPVEEPPYAGTPLDDDWPGYHTHWTPIPVPQPPEA